MAINLDVRVKKANNVYVKLTFIPIANITTVQSNYSGVKYITVYPATF